MKDNKTPLKDNLSMSPIERGLLACAEMNRQLRAEQKRWKLPLLVWEKGRVVAKKP